MNIVQILVSLLITAVSLYIISKIPPLGVEIDSPQKALVSAAVFGLLNAFLKPVLQFIGFPLTILTLGLFLLVINVIIFALAAKLVEGFRLRYGFISAALGAFCLSLVNGIIDHFLNLAIR